MGKRVLPPKGGTPNEIVTRKFYFVHGCHTLFARSNSGGNELPAMRFKQLKIYLPIALGVKAQNS
jgi:hypothetical protein